MTKILISNRWQRALRMPNAYSMPYFSSSKQGNKLAKMKRTQQNSNQKKKKKRNRKQMLEVAAVAARDDCIIVSA